MLYTIGKNLCKLVLIVFGRFRVFGLENLPSQGGYLLCSNHRSYIDPPAVGVAVPRKLRFMAKAELFDLPVLGWAFRRVGAFPVRRGTADRQALKYAIDLLKSGESLVLFPEGTRSLDGKLLEAGPGVGLIALRAQCPCVPAALINTEKLLPPHAKFFHFARVRVIYGSPLDFSDLWGRTDRQAIEEVGKRIIKSIAELIEEDARRNAAG